MRFILTACLAWFAYPFATEAMVQSALGVYIRTLQSLSPELASAAGTGVIWPAIYLVLCYGVTGVVLDGLFGTAECIAQKVVARQGTRAQSALTR